MKRLTMQLTGTVQGVGFRPFIYTLANRLGLTGYVINNSLGVKIDVEGDDDKIKDFEKLIYSQCPPMADIITAGAIHDLPLLNYIDFKIIESSYDGSREVSITPDISTCSDCYRELNNVNDRRYHYPFINCTNCGPRFSILKDLPYDRDNTTMRVFTMCKACQQEYDDPQSRRFHAQPNACPVCGPVLSLYGTGLISQGEMALKNAIEYLKKGAIISIKGIGGFHLCCDALNDAAVKLLRVRKNRPLKPFAVMFKDIESIKKYAIPTSADIACIESRQRPVVIIKKKNDTELSPSLAPNLRQIGVILPYTPLHYLLIDTPLVMTSANISDLPIISDNDEALFKFFSLSDYILLHNRDIKNHCDDSVIKVINKYPLLIRRSRGYAAIPLRLPIKLNKKILALGGHQKSIIALGIGDIAVASQYIGDLSDTQTQDRFREVINNLTSMYGFIPDLIIHDKHPGYYSTKWALSNDCPSIGIQHHHAHAMSVMADNGVNVGDEILTVTWDGSGYGDDGNIWGGEFLLSSYHGYKRLYHFDSFRLIGGEKAVKEPKRVALSLLFHMYGRSAMDMNLGCVEIFTDTEKEILYTAWERGINSPQCSSAGRIIDGAASILNILQELSYEGQSGMMMEEMYDKSIIGFYPYEIRDGKILWQGLIKALIEDRSEITVRVTRFINTLAQIVIIIAGEVGKPIGLSGGVFQNKILTEKIIELGDKKGIPILTHKFVPPNDGGLFLGQLMCQRKD